MKIVIISSAFFETSLPLAKYMSKDADITFYALLSVRFKTPPNLDLNTVEIKENKIISFYELNSQEHYLYDYLKPLILRINILLYGNSIYKNLISTYLLSKHIKRSKPDVIHLIGSSYYFVPLYFLLWFKKIIHSFHEIEISRIKGKKREWKNIINSLHLRVLINLAILKKCKIILFSRNIYSQFIHNKKHSVINRVKYIPFGIFEIYKSIAINDKNEYFNLPPKFYLFFGYIYEYKGADILVKAIDLVSKTTEKQVYFVFAGKNANSLYNGSIPKNVYIIDKFLTDNELAYLVNNCKAVIAPHKSASQSGIPNTAFAFNKPIIASNINGLKDFIKDENNGLLFDKEDYMDLASKILKLDSDKNLYDKIVHNIENNTQSLVLDWESIGHKTLQFYYN